jgi:antitoxin MazE
MGRDGGAPASIRAGWTDAAKRVAQAGDDSLVWPELGNAGDDELKW